MDRRALDAAYNNSAAVADSSNFIADWRRRSDAPRKRLPEHLDLPFGQASATRLDFFSCGLRDAPTLLFFHGGYWQYNAKEGFAFVADGPLAHGFHVAVAGYTLAPEARMDTIVAEVRSALHWLHDELPALGVDPSGIYLSGWSAGAHLAAMLMDEPVAQGGITISGIFDLEPIRLNYLNDKLGLDVEEARRNSPLLHLPTRAGKLIISVGSDELVELKRRRPSFPPLGASMDYLASSKNCRAVTTTRRLRNFRIPTAGSSKRS